MARGGKAATRAAEGIIAKAVKDLFRVVEKDVGKDAGRDAARAAERDAARAVERDAAGQAEKDAAGRAERDAARPLDSRRTCNDPVDVGTGEVVLRQLDVQLPGALPLLLQRVHVSSYRQGRWFGASWASTLDQRLELDAAGLRYFADDGTTLFYPLRRSTLASYPVAGPRLRLDRLGGGYRISDPRAGRAQEFLPTPVSGAYALAAVVDRAGHRVEVDHGADGAPRLVRHSGGYRIAVESAAGRIAALRLETEPGAGVEMVRFGYDADGRLSEVVNSSGLPMRFDYDAAGRLVRWVDRNGRWYGYRYDESGRCAGTDGSGGRLASTIGYDDTARATVVVGSDGRTQRFERNELGQVVREIDPLGGVTALAFDGFDRVLSSTDPLGRTTRYDYDDTGNLVRTTRPDGSTLTATYTADNLPSVVIDAAGARTEYDWDARGNLVSVTDPTGARSRYGYDAAGQLTTVTDPLGSVRSVTCNAAGLPVVVLEPDGGRTGFDRDAFGRVVAITDPVGGVTRFGYTVEGKLRWRMNPDGLVCRCEYDPEGNLVAYTDGVGNTTTFEIGDLDLPVARVEADGGRWSFSYDAELQLTAVTDPAGQAWRYRYDAAGRRITETDVNGRTTRYEWDAAGQLVAQGAATGRVTFRHDLLGNVVRRASPDKITTYDYDAANRLVRAADADSEVLLERDRSGRVVAEIINGRTVRSVYDPVGRRLLRRTHSGAESAWRYGPGRRPVALERAGHTVQFGHDAAGRETGRRLAAGAQVVQTYTPSHRLAEVSLIAPPAQVGEPRRPAQHRHHRTYGYDRNGSVVAVDEPTGGRRLQLDLLGRVGAVTGPEWTERYAYSPLGDLRYAQWHATATATEPEPGDDAHTLGARQYRGTLLEQAGNTHYRYDAGGRLTMRARRTLSGKTLVWRYTWDAEDRLTAVVDPDGQRWRYCYDPLGRRMATQRVSEGGSVVEQTDFCWDGTALAERTRWPAAAGTHPHTTTWDYRPGTHQPVTQTDEFRRPDATGASPVRLHLVLTDPVGTPTELVTPEGTVAWQRSATVWGASIRTVGAAEVDCPLRLPGQYHDVETGLHYNYRRYYDPAAARYHSPDPLGRGGGPNPHGYVLHPLVWSDPLGLGACDEALDALGVDAAGREAFARGDVTQFSFPTAHGSVDGFLQHSDGRLTAQIFSIHDTEGGGAGGFLHFYRQSMNLGRSLGVREVEIQGGAIINRDVASGLAARGFLPKQVQIPEALGGGGAMDVLYKIFPLR